MALQAENDRRLDESPQGSSPSSPSRSTPATAHSHDSPLQSDLFDDIFGSGSHVPSSLDDSNGSSAPSSSDAAAGPSSLHPQEPSDIPRLRGVHITAGYRDGIDASRKTAGQAGFDEGYVLGAALGLRSGYLLGIIEGILAGITDHSPEQARIKLLLDQANEEVALSEMMNTNYMNPDGTWKWPLATDPNAREDDDETTINHVADSHPIIQKWSSLLADLMKQAGVKPDLHR